MNDCTILVVDDNPQILTLVKHYLEGDGFMVITAEDGKMGLAAHARNRAVIKLLLTDVDMPGMTGAEMADHVLLEDPSLPVLFMSGSFPSANRGSGCISKPFRGAELVIRIRMALTAVA